MNGKGITDTSGLAIEAIRGLIELAKVEAGWLNTNGSARKWWLSWEQDVHDRPSLCLRVLEELRLRKITISEFFLAYLYSNTNNIQTNLDFIDLVIKIIGDRRPLTSEDFESNSL